MSLLTNRNVGLSFLLLKITTWISTGLFWICINVRNRNIMGYSFFCSCESSLVGVFFFLWTRAKHRIFCTCKHNRCSCRLTNSWVPTQLTCCRDLFVFSHAFKSENNHASQGCCQENTGLLKVLCHCQGKITEREFLPEQLPKQFLMIMITMEKWRETVLLYNMMKVAVMLQITAFPAHDFVSWHYFN